MHNEQIPFSSMVRSLKSRIRKLPRFQILGRRLESLHLLLAALHGKLPEQILAGHSLSKFPRISCTRLLTRQCHSGGGTPERETDGPSPSQSDNSPGRLLHESSRIFPTPLQRLASLVAPRKPAPTPGARAPADTLPVRPRKAALRLCSLPPRERSHLLNRLDRRC